MGLPDIVFKRSGRAARVGRWYARHRYAILFYSLLFTIAFIPVTTSASTRLPLMKALLVTNLVAAALSTITRRLRRVLFAAAIVVFVIVYPVEIILDVNLLAGGLGLWSITAAVAAGNAVAFAIRARRVDSEHLFAALSAYLLAGLVFGVVHFALERAVPGSYGVNDVALAGPFDISEAVYFSFVTLATLGYGDIVPVSEAARSIAIVEAIIGQLYLAVMIARIVSMYVPRGDGRHRAPRADEDDDL